MATFRPDVVANEANLIDIAALAAVNGDFKETMRRLKRAERNGEVIRQSTPTAAKWYWAKASA